MTDVQGGIPFDSEDVGTGESGDHRARPSRIRVDSLVTLFANSVGVEATACDVSQNGLKVEVDSPLEPGPITLKLPGFPIFSGVVRWRDAHHIGVQFLRPIPWDFLATWVETHGSKGRG